MKTKLMVACALGALVGQSLLANPLYRFGNGTKYKVEVWADFINASGGGDTSTFVGTKCDNFGWTSIGAGSHTDTTRNRGKNTTCSLLNQVEYKVHNKDNSFVTVKTNAQFYNDPSISSLFRWEHGGQEGKAQIKVREKKGKPGEFEIVAGAIDANL